MFDENSEEYYICFNEECDVVYFQDGSLNFYNTSDLNIPVWFKKDANPKYICYCNKVTEEQIISAVIDNGARNMKDIIDLTGAMINGRCELKNPLGQCCSPYILELVRKTIREMKK